MVLSYHPTFYNKRNAILFNVWLGRHDPMEIGEPSPRTTLFEPVGNEEELRTNLDLLQEVREIAHIKEYAVKARLARRHARKMVRRDFKAQDLVLKKITQKAENNKLMPNWEGPLQSCRRCGMGSIPFRAPRWPTDTTYLECQQFEKEKQRRLGAKVFVNKSYKTQNRRP
ncbi:hypothetical protein CR513_58487, partial [Mucuna pruriens]